jgi:hypothetical protein
MGELNIIGIRHLETNNKMADLMLSLSLIILNIN